MRVLVDEHGRVREGDLALVARELGILRADFDVATWVVKALGWVDLTLGAPRGRLCWRPSLLRHATAEAARDLVIKAALEDFELVRWTDRWKSSIGDGMAAAWALGEAINPRRPVRVPFRVTRRGIEDLYRDRNVSLIEDLSRVTGRIIDRATAADLVETTPSGLLGMVECRGPGRPFHYLRVGRCVRLFDHPGSYIGRDLRESSDPAFSAACVASYDAAMASGEPVVEDIEGEIQFAGGGTHHVAYRRVLLRVAGSANGGGIIMKTSQHLRAFLPAAT
ncbi:MAG: hypothetical protein FJX54_13115 [Alphaproteobacteria bacterium]|nr:hypothetical protein [Alphaproteobacteria bacterium]